MKNHWDTIGADGQPESLAARLDRIDASLLAALSRLKSIHELLRRMAGEPQHDEPGPRSR